jgi:hypothetical protein
MMGMALQVLPHGSPCATTFFTTPGTPSGDSGRESENGMLAFPVRMCTGCAGMPGSNYVFDRLTPMVSSHPARSICFGVLAFLLALPALLRAAEMQPGEAQIIAERICSFPRFVDWQARKFLQPDAPFVIGVYGANSVTDLLRETIQDRRIKDHPVVVKQVLAKEELPGCHLVFVSRSENARLDPILNAVRRAGVLTVGESDNFLKRGGVINLIDIDGTIHFQINQENAKRERLVISSKLLQLSLPQNFEIGGVAASLVGHP